MTCILYHDVFLRHDTGPHPENAERLRAVLDHLRGSGSSLAPRFVTPRIATLEEVTRVHAGEHVEAVRALAAAGGGRLDPDTVVSEESFEAAMTAAGAAVNAVELAVEGATSHAFCLVRPPGHHALPARGMGFCIFNNIAIAARHAQAMGIQRVAILDFDIHHGNGTEAAVARDPGVLFVSTHQWPFYPGTGSRREPGKGEAEGAVINIPLPAGTNGARLLEHLEREAVPAIDRFRPELLLVSAGFDTHAGDPIGQFALRAPDYFEIGALVRRIARGHSGGRTISLLEGGYDTNALPICVEQYLLGLE